MSENSSGTKRRPMTDEQRASALFVELVYEIQLESYSTLK